MSQADHLPLWENNLPVLLDGGAAKVKEAPKPRRISATPARRSDGEAEACVAQTAPPVSEAVAEAERIRAAAQAEAERIIAEAVARTEQARQEARAQGLETARDQVLAAFEAVCEALRTELTADLNRRWRELEQDAARLCADLAARVIRSKVAEDDEVVVRVVREGLARMVGAKGVTVRVGPAGEQALLAARESICRDLPSTLTVDIVPDPLVEPGGAVLHSTHGELDLQVETQLRRLAEELERAIQRELEREGSGP